MLLVIFQEINYFLIYLKNLKILIFEKKEINFLHFLIILNKVCIHFQKI